MASSMRSARLGVVKSADGSCRLRSRAGVAALAYASGPSSGGGRASRWSASFAPTAAASKEAELRVALLSAAGAAAMRALKATEALLADCLRQCLRLTEYPNLHICVTALLLESPSSVSPAEVAAGLLTACTLALLDAGLSMSRVPLACADSAAGRLLVYDNVAGCSVCGDGLLAVWGAPPPAEALAPDGPVATELQGLEDFVRRVCERRVRRLAVAARPPPVATAGAKKRKAAA